MTSPKIRVSGPRCIWSLKLVTIIIWITVIAKQKVKSVLADRTSARSMITYWHYTVVCLTVCLSVTKCIVAKRNTLHQTFLNTGTGGFP